MAGQREIAVGLRGVRRRCVLKSGCALALAAPFAAHGDAAEEAAAAPRENDALVFVYGERAGEIIAPVDVVAGAKQIIALPMDPATQRVRDGARLNQLIVVRLDAATLAAETQPRAAEGIVAYSGVCSHTGCDVTDWYPDVAHFKCPCHESEFDPADGARVVGGPAPWQLAALPLKIVAGALLVAGPFVGRLGFQALDPFAPQL
jgi:rieske iron-sulfur protein